jgi:hypothetical protein
MNISVKDGKRKITLTKTERSQMAAALVICGELSKQVNLSGNGKLQQAALTAEAGLSVLLAEFRADAGESELEAAAEATTATVK